MEMHQNGHLTEFEKENIDDIQNKGKANHFDVEDDSEVETSLQGSRSMKEDLFRAIVNPVQVQTEHQLPWEREGTFSKLIKVHVHVNYLNFNFLKIHTLI